MDPASLSRTRSSLLARLREDATDQDAWAEFVARYSPQIAGWCRRFGLQPVDVEEVTQTVLVKLASKMRTFAYDPTQSFRGWLRTLTRHAWSDFVADRRRAAAPEDSAATAALEMMEARDDLERHLAKVFNLELLEHAMSLVRQRVEPHTWEAFHLTAVEGLSGAEVGARLGMPVANVFKAKSNVRKWLQEEVRRLEGLDPS
jgi:RNA polymerase sigma-70 factor (ECF subfamily)